MSTIRISLDKSDTVIQNRVFISILEHYMTMMKTYLNNLYETSDHHNNRINYESQNLSVSESYPSSFTKEQEEIVNLNLPKEEIIVCYPEAIIFPYFINKLSAAQSKLCAFNNFLRMNFELLNEMPHAMHIFIESTSFLCAICDEIFCDLDSWIKHDTIYHNSANNRSVFYCVVCCIYHIRISTKVSDHIKSVEHNIMLEFQTYMNKNKIKIMINKNMDSTVATNDDPDLKVKNKNKQCVEFECKHSCEQKCKTVEENDKLLSQPCYKIVPIEDIPHIEEFIFSLFIDKLSAAQPNRCAFNNHLRMNFELLIKMPHAINVFIESESFFCVICNIIFCEKYYWIKHSVAFHNNINNPLVLYCSICHIYYIRSSIYDHVNSVEHNVMVEFQGYMNKNKIKSKIHNNTISNLVNDNQDSKVKNKDKKTKMYKKNNKRIKQKVNKNTLVDDNQKLKIEVQNDKNGNSIISNEHEVMTRENILETDSQNPKYKSNNKDIHIKIEDMNDDLKTDNYYLLNKLLKNKYGKFDQISNKPLIICFKNIKQIKSFIGDKKKLKEQYGLTMQVIGQNQKKQLSLDTIELLSNWNLMCTTILDQLQNMDMILHSSQIHVLVKKLCDSVCNLNFLPNSLHIHIFGSRAYGLATDESDVDMYLEIDNTFNGQISNNAVQINLVKAFANRCSLYNKKFQNIKKICHARVPIVKFYHVPTKLHCDVSFKSGLSVCNTKLIRWYLSLNKAVMWLVCVIVKIWAPQNGLKDKTAFTNYALIWLVLFYLMIKKVVPPLVDTLKNINKNDHVIVEGWDCTFGKWSGVCKTLNHRELLLGFFEYYANKNNLKNSVLCTNMGHTMKKKNFVKTFIGSSSINKIQRAKFLTFPKNVKLTFEKFDGLVLQDPFELSFNMTRKINNSNLTDFCGLCNLSVSFLKHTTNNM